MAAKKKLLRAGVALILAIVAADALVSLCLIRDGMLFGRPLPPFGAITHPEQRATIERMENEPKGTSTFDRELGWVWRPSSQDGIFQIDAVGARGPREYGLEPAPGKRRVIAFGDSFTFGDEVSVEASYEWILENLDPGLEVLNMGVSGYGTDQALLRFRRTGRMGAEVVCIGILLENIGRNVNRYRPLWNTRTGICLAKPRFVLGADGGLELVPQPFESRDELHAAILDGSVIGRIAENEYWLGRPTVPTGKLSSFVRIAAGYLAYRARTPAILWQEPEGEPFRVTLAILESFQHEARASGARLAPILVFPAKEDLRLYALQDRPYWGALFAELERRKLDAIDLVTPLAAKARELGGDPASLYNGGHLSKSGNAVVARTLLAWIRNRPI